MAPNDAQSTIGSQLDIGIWSFSWSKTGSLKMPIDDWPLTWFWNPIVFPIQKWPSACICNPGQQLNVDLCLESSDCFHDLNLSHLTVNRNKIISNIIYRLVWSTSIWNLSSLLLSLLYIINSIFITNHCCFDCHYLRLGRVHSFPQYCCYPIANYYLSALTMGMFAALGLSLLVLAGEAV